MLTGKRRDPENLLKTRIPEEKFVKKLTTDLHLIGGFFEVNKNEDSRITV